MSKGYHPRGDRRDARGADGNLEGAALPGRARAARSTDGFREGVSHGRPGPSTSDLLRAAQAHNQPPETPRDAMWEAIQRQRRAPTVVRRMPRRWSGRPWLPLAAAAAAILAVGIGIGRITDRPGTDSRCDAPEDPARRRRTGLPSHRDRAPGTVRGVPDALPRTVGRTSDHRLASATARQLLTTNRLLLDSPAAVDRRTRLLLEDLELVLAEIAQLSPHSPAEDVDLIREGIERGDVLPRLRTAVPSGTVPSQGAL